MAGDDERGALYRAGRGAIRATRRPLRRALELTVRGSVMVSEYELHPQARYGWDRPAHPELLALLREGDHRYAEALEGCARHVDFFRTIPRARQPDGPSWDSDFWGYDDAAFQCAALIDRNPATYLEVGSGFSTMFARKAIADHGLRTKIVSIDPFPRAEVDALCDESIRTGLELVDIGAIVARLEPGDVVLVDGSHTAFMNGDSVVSVFELLPRLPAGVLVGIDDIFLPWDYPPDWTDRWYAEQYLLGAFLLGGGGAWSVKLPTFYVTEVGDFGAALAPLDPVTGRGGTAMWLEAVALGASPIGSAP